MNIGGKEFEKVRFIIIILISALWLWRFCGSIFGILNSFKFQMFPHERRILCESFWLCNTTPECFRKAITVDTLKELLKCTFSCLSPEECSGLNTAQAVTPASVACCWLLQKIILTCPSAFKNSCTVIHLQWTSKAFKAKMWKLAFS